MESEGSATPQADAGSPDRDSSASNPGDGGAGDPGGNPYGDDTDGPGDGCGPALSCGDTELCGEMNDGDGNDDDCDGTIDEGCTCAADGVTRSCFLGPPGRRGVGSCADGVMTCTEFLTWGPCVGGQFPSDEVCDGADNDCNGTPDDGLSNCSTTLDCPATQHAAPLNRHALRGGEIYTGASRSWRWTIECPATVTSCPAPDDPSARDTSVFFVQSGTYRASLEVETDTGERLGCSWAINVQGMGLRVELMWDTQGEGRGNTDLDLHLHQKTGSSSSGETEFFTDDDCYFSNCKASSYRDGLREAWGLSDTHDMSACDDAPHGQGARWVDRGACYNPRLDVDIINCNPSVRDPEDYGFCAPENINIDNPEPGEPYRVMVNYWSAHGYSGVTRPTVNIYCGGELRAALGQDIELRNGTSAGASNDNWLVADVVFRESDRCGGGFECEVAPLGVVQQGADFGPPWSF